MAAWSFNGEWGGKRDSKHTFKSKICMMVVSDTFHGKKNSKVRGMGSITGLDR